MWAIASFVYSFGPQLHFWGDDRNLTGCLLTKCPQSRANGKMEVRSGCSKSIEPGHPSWSSGVRKIVLGDLASELRPRWQEGVSQVKLGG